MNQRRRIILFGLVMLLVAQGWAAPSQQEGRDPAAAVSPIRIHYQSEPLAKLASELERRSGIVISVPTELAADRVSRDVRAYAWSDIVKQVFEDYDYAAVTNDEGQLRRIFLQARVSRAAVPSPGAETRQRQRIRQQADVRTPTSGSVLPKRFQGFNPGSVVPIDIPFERLGKLKRGESISVTLGGEQTRVFHDRRWTHENGETSWVGSLDPAFGVYRAVLTYGADGSAVGYIKTPAGVFKVEQADEKTWAIDMKATGLRPGTLAEDQQSAHAAESAVAATHFIAASSARPSTVDLMVLYAPGVNEDRPVTRVNHLIALTRQAFADSDVFVELRLVHTAPLSDHEQKSNLDALKDLTENRLSLDVAAMRQKYGADLVAWVRPFHSTPQGSCGVAWVAGSNQQPMSRDAGFAVVSDGYDGRYYCHDYTFSHELGHLFGNAHDQRISSPGIFPFSYAWGIPGEFATIMSYLFDQAPLVGKFANPAIACTPDGRPCGDREIADNARTINLTAPTVAGFADTANP